jgi:hypothetical protein
LTCELIHRRRAKPFLTQKQRSARHSYRQKVEVLSHYSGGPPKCVACGYVDIRALSIDHINGGGTKERRENKTNGQNLYRWLRKKGYPEGYQVLCMNCQFIKRVANNEYYMEGANKWRGV